MQRIDALAVAFLTLNGYTDPTSKAFRNQNPGLLKAFSPKHVSDGEGYRVFSNLSSGFDNLKIDLIVKCSGKSRVKLTPENTLRDLVLVYENTAAAARVVKNFLRRALDNDEIYENTKLQWFIEELPKVEHEQA